MIAALPAVRPSSVQFSGKGPAVVLLANSLLSHFRPALSTHSVYLPKGRFGWGRTPPAAVVNERVVPQPLSVMMPVAPTTGVPLLAPASVPLITSILTGGR